MPHKAQMPFILGTFATSMVVATAIGPPSAASIPKMVFAFAYN